MHQISSTRKVLPSGYEVFGTLSLPGSRPRAYGASREVHKGSLDLSARKEDVCIKRLRLHRDGDQEKIKEVSYSHGPLPFLTNSEAAPWGSHFMEISESP